MAINIEAEIRDLKRRVGELEGSFGFLIRQIKAVHKDLLAFQTKDSEPAPGYAWNCWRAMREVLGPARGRSRSKP